MVVKNPFFFHFFFIFWQAFATPSSAFQMLREKCFSLATRATSAALDARANFKRALVAAHQSICEPYVYGLQPVALGPTKDDSCEHPNIDDSIWLFAVPKRRVTRAKKRIRKTHKYIKKKTNITTCPKCGNAKLMHHLCPFCFPFNAWVRSKGETMRHELSGKELTRRTEKSEKREFAEKLERKGKALYMWRGERIDDPSGDDESVALAENDDDEHPKTAT